MRQIDRRVKTPNAPAGTVPHPETSPWRGVRLLLVTVFATELAMLNIIFLARAQASLAGLVAAVVWPWIAALGGIAVWSTKDRWAPALAQRAWPLQPKVSLGFAAGLAAIVLISRLVVAG
jgi:hypothetical protein